MASLDLAISFHKLDTEFFTDHVQHRTFRSGASLGRPRVAVVENWYRDRDLGRGSFGTVFRERSGERDRAVRDIAKDRCNRIDYKRNLFVMAIVAKRGDLFVQLFGWYESDHFIHIAMEFFSHGNLRQYLHVERSESDAKAITRQLLEGLSFIHQEGFAHRDLKPENIFVAGISPIWVKIGDFGLADGTHFRSQGVGYIAPEMLVSSSRETLEDRSAIDIWALGCIAHEILTGVPPLQSVAELLSYCYHPKLPRNVMAWKNISKSGIEFVERALAYPSEYRITAREALDLEWLRLEDEALETEECAGPASPKSQPPREVRPQIGITVPAPKKPPSWKWPKKSEGGTGQALLERSASRGEAAKEYFRRRRLGLSPAPAEIVKPLGKDYLDTPSTVQGSAYMVPEIMTMRAPRPARKERPLGKGHQEYTDGKELGKLNKQGGGERLAANPFRRIPWYRASEEVPSYNFIKFNDSRGPVDGVSDGPSVSDGALLAERSTIDWMPLLIEARNADEEETRLLLDRDGLAVGSMDSTARTLLSLAAEHGLEAVVKLLLYREDVEPDSKDKSNRTPLSYAAQKGNGAVAGLLLRRPGVDPDSRDESNRTPLSYAAQNGHEMVVGRLLCLSDVDSDSKDKSNRTPLSYAAENGCAGVVRLLLYQKGVDPNSKDELNRTPLSYAVQNGHETAVVLLLDWPGVDANLGDSLGRTPLSYAAGNVVVERLLLGRPGVHPDWKDKSKRTPLSFAAQDGHEAATARLLQSRQEVKDNLKDNQGFVAGSEHEPVEDSVKENDGQGLVDSGSLISERALPDLEDGGTESSHPSVGDGSWDDPSVSDETLLTEQNEPEPGSDGKESHYSSLGEKSLEREGKYLTGVAVGRGAQGVDLAIPASELVNPVALPSRNCTDEWPAQFANGKTDIRFDNGDVWSFSNQIRGRIEDYIGAPVDWWPLSPREKALPNGFTRVRWTCGCGEGLSAIQSAAFRTRFEQWLSTRNGELPALSPRSSSTSQRGDLEETISSGNTGRTPPSVSFLPSPASQGGDPASIATGGSSNDTPSPPPPSSQSSTENREGDLAPEVAGGSSNGTHSTSPPPPKSSIRNLLWCVNLERTHTVVETIPVDMNDNDREVFMKLRQVYNATRSWRRAILCFHILKEIRYVRLTRYHLKRVSCGREQELPTLDNRNYKYEFPYEEEIPPFPVEGLLHFFHDPSCAGTSSFALTSFPKKLSEGVDHVSWGLHACERLSAARVTGAILLGLVATLIFAARWLEKHNNDLQNAFTPCVIFLALVAICFEVYVHCLAPEGMA